jgi:hypothetical protein
MIQATTSQSAQPVTPAPPAPPARTTLERDVQRIVEEALEGVRASVPQNEAGARTRAKIDEAIARMNARRAGARAEIAQPPFDPSVFIPPQAVEITYGFFITVATIIIGLPLARAFARRMDRRGAAPAPELNQRLDRMEQAIEAVAVEVERISEGQRFVTRLLAEERGLTAGSPGDAWPQRKEPEPVGRTGPEPGRL